MEYQHTPVLLHETIEGLRIRPQGVYLDGTLGGGGHSEQILLRLTAGGRLIGLDQDGDAIRAATARLSRFGQQAVLVRDNYGNAAQVVRLLGEESLDGILLDLGVSSYQFDAPERGFSYRVDAPLDMRMDDRQSVSAKTIVNTYPEEELIRILREYGEEPSADRIAGRIVRERQKAPIETTGELDRIVKSAIPAKQRRSGGYPSKRTFQAIRIECNRELEVLSESLAMLIGLLSPGGRICVITFHSLEDRIVKRAFQKSENPCTCPPSFPVCVCGKKPVGRIVTRKPVLPTRQEIENNPRAKSAKLRIFEKGDTQEETYGSGI